MRRIVDSRVGQPYRLSSWRSVQRQAEECVFLEAARHSGGARRPELVEERGQAVGVVLRAAGRRAVNDLHGARVADAAARTRKALDRYADRQIRSVSNPEVPRRQAGTEPVMGLGDVRDVDRILRPDLRRANGNGKERRGTVDDVHFAGILDVPGASGTEGNDTLARRADRQVGEAVAIEVAGGESRTEYVAGLAPVEAIAGEQRVLDQVLDGTNQAAGRGRRTAQRRHNP